MKYEGPSTFQADARSQMANSRRGVSYLAPWVKRIPPMFAVIVILPTLVTAIYYLLIAAPMYESEAQFVVRDKSQATGPASSLGGGSMLSSLGIGGGGGQDQTAQQEVVSYMTSRDVITDLQRELPLRKLLNRPESDFISRYPRPFEGTTFENLFLGYQRFVTVGIDNETEIATLKVVGYRPDDAQQMADAMLRGGEDLVNRMNARTLADTVGQGERQVADAEAQAAKAKTNLTMFRNRNRLVDPMITAPADVQLLTGLEAQVATLKAQRAGLAASAPQSPQLQVLDRNIAGYEAQMEAERARESGRADSLAPKLGEYERLLLDENIAGISLGAAEQVLEGARLEAVRKQLYLERIVNPNRPDKSEQPERWRAIFTVLIASLVAYAAIALLVAGLREHRQH
jgi:capsular polysaccharide transport system permease protein